MLAAACGALPKRPDLPTGGDPFAPTSVRIHPLTHTDGAAPGLAPGQSMVLLHFELRDAYADSVKALGEVKVELYKAGEGVTPGIESQTLTWDIHDLANPETNTARFDPATRTYRVPLIAPDWVAKDATGRRSRLTLRLVFTPTTPTGRRSWFEDNFTLQD